MRDNLFKTVLSTLALTGLMLGTVVTPATAAPSSIIYQGTASQFVCCDYLMTLSNPPMKAALTSALKSNELANLPIFVTDSNGKVVDYLAAINKNENYATALLDSTVNNVIAPATMYQMYIDGTVTPRPVLAPLPLSHGTVGTAYTYTVNIIVTGGTPPYNYALASGSSLPAGLTMGTDGTISGTPTVSGTAIFTVNVIAMPQTYTAASQTFSITVNPTVLGLPSATLPNSTVIYPIQKIHV